MRIIGHERVWELLQSQIARRALPHAYLFWGQDMVGKHTIARACAVLLERNIFSDDNHILNDCLEIYPNETRTIGIDRIRELRYFASQKPNVSPYRTVIIDEAHLLTDEAQNALLKIAEDPPASMFLILIVRDPEILRPTVRSRFQQLYFGPVPQNETTLWLREALGCTKEAAERAARRSFGAPGRAYASMKDPLFQKSEKRARMFLSLSPGERRTFLKDLVAEDTFELTQFLDAILVALYETPRRDWPMLRRALALRIQAALYNLNPRLQLESLC